MNENIEVNQEDLQENSVQTDNTNENNETVAETTQVENNETFTIVIDGQEQNYLIQTYKEMKITNFLLYLLLVTIVLMFVLSKFYYFAKSIFRVRF